VIGNYAIWVTLTEFHSGSPSTCIAGTVSEMHVGVFFISVSVRSFDYNTTHRLVETMYKPISLVRDLVTATKRTWVS